jgi:hypothetical protein
LLLALFWSLPQPYPSQYLIFSLYIFSNQLVYTKVLEPLLHFWQHLLCMTDASFCFLLLSDHFRTTWIHICSCESHINLLPG